MPGEVGEEDEEVAFPVQEVPGWDRYVTAAGVLHDQDLPRERDKVLRDVTLALRNVPPLKITAEIGNL